VIHKEVKLVVTWTGLY